MNPLPRPLVKTDLNNHAFGRKLSKLIATMRRLPEPPIKTQAQPAITNGMTAYGEWDSMRGEAQDGAML
jgi:hypothetical protein